MLKCVLLQNEGYNWCNEGLICIFTTTTTIYNYDNYQSCFAVQVGTSQALRL
jgi:hypothetical protein